MAIGGAEDKLGNKTILSRFVELAGGSSARIAVVSTASSLGHRITELYLGLFLELGAAEVYGLRPWTRAEADAPEAAAAVRRSTGVFLTGGNQLRLSMVVEATGLGRALVEAHERGAVTSTTMPTAIAMRPRIFMCRSGASPGERTLSRAAAPMMLTAPRRRIAPRPARSHPNCRCIVSTRVATAETGTTAVPEPRLPSTVTRTL